MTLSNKRITIIFGGLVNRLIRSYQWWYAAFLSLGDVKGNEIQNGIEVSAGISVPGIHGINRASRAGLTVKILS